MNFEEIIIFESLFNMLLPRKMHDSTYCHLFLHIRKASVSTSFSTLHCRCFGLDNIVERGSYVHSIWAVCALGAVTPAPAYTPSLTSHGLQTLPYFPWGLLYPPPQRGGIVFFLLYRKLELCCMCDPILGLCQAILLRALVLRWGWGQAAWPFGQLSACYGQGDRMWLMMG